MPLVINNLRIDTHAYTQHTHTHTFLRHKKPGAPAEGLFKKWYRSTFNYELLICDPAWENHAYLYTKYTSLHYIQYLTFCVSCARPVNCIGFWIVSCPFSKRFIDSYSMFMQKVIKLWSLKKLPKKFCVYISTVFSCRVTYNDLLILGLHYLVFRLFTGLVKGNL